MRKSVLKVAVVVCLLVSAVIADQRVSEMDLHERVYAIVPLTGAGPLLVPPTVGVGRDQILSWSWEPSDDGKFAIMEFVARDKAALKPILANKQVVKAFERRKHGKDEVERELKKFKVKFSMDRQEFRGGARP